MNNLSSPQPNSSPSSQKALLGNDSSSQLAMRSINMWNFQKFQFDSSNREYDGNILLNLLLREKKQFNSLLMFKNLESNRKEKIQSILEYSFQLLSQESEISKAANFPKIKLLTLMFLESSLIMNEKVHKDDIQFLLQNSWNIALKMMSVLFENQDFFSWIDQKTINDYNYWNHQIFLFENSLYKILGWNLDLVSPCDFMNFFLDNHFQEIDQNSDFSKSECEEDIQICYLKKQWSSFSIAIGCLLYHLSQQDEGQKNYLCFLIKKYKQDFSRKDLFDLEEIKQVSDYLEQEAAEAQEQQNKEDQNGETINFNLNNNDSDDQVNFEAQDISLEAEEEDLEDKCTNQSENILKEIDSSIKTQQESTLNKKRTSSESYSLKKINSISYGSSYQVKSGLKESFQSCSTLASQSSNSENTSFEDSDSLEPEILKQRRTSQSDFPSLFFS